MNKEIEEILDKLKDKDWYEELDLTGTKWIELKLLLSYIEQLEKKVELGEHYKHLYSEVKKQKDDVVEYIKSNCILSDEWTELDFCNFVPTGKISYKALKKEKIKDLLRMLGEIDE